MISRKQILAVGVVMIVTICVSYALPVAQRQMLLTAVLVFGLAAAVFLGLRWSKETSESDPESPVVITTRRDEMQAAVVVDRLQAEGINAVAVGTFTSGFQVEIASWVKIVVPRQQVERAKEMLENLDEEEED